MDEQLKQLHDATGEKPDISFAGLLQLACLPLSSPSPWAFDSTSTLSNHAAETLHVENQLFVVQRLETSNLMPVVACAHGMLRPRKL